MAHATRYSHIAHATIVRAALCACRRDDSRLEPAVTAIAVASALVALAACGGGNSAPATGSAAVAVPQCSTPTTPALNVPPGLTIRTIACVTGARQLAALPNGDLLVGTLGSSVYIVPNAEAAGAAGAPQIFATLNDSAAQGVAFDPTTRRVFFATQYHLWSTPYNDGDLSAKNVQQIASVRTGPLANPGDGDVHVTTSVAVSGSTLYASMGSSCNSCSGETDPTRAAIWKMNFDGSNMALVAKHIRNAIALTADPQTGHVWAGVAGQDSLPQGHPYEFVDDVTAHASTGVADYGWPYCEENHVLYITGAGAPANCAREVQPLVEFPAYITHIGATFYPLHPAGTYAFPQTYSGALIVTSHGSWHAVNGCTFAPEVDYVPMNGDTPRTSVNWNTPNAQYSALVSGFQTGCATRIGRPTGIAVGAQGSVFIADDQAGVIYRVRP